MLFKARYHSSTSVLQPLVYSYLSVVKESAPLTLDFPLIHSCVDTIIPEDEKFPAVMQSKTPKVMKALGNYIFTCLKKRGLSAAVNQNPP